MSRKGYWRQIQRERQEAGQRDRPTDRQKKKHSREKRGGGSAAASVLSL